MFAYLTARACASCCAEQATCFCLAVPGVDALQASQCLPTSLPERVHLTAPEQATHLGLAAPGVDALHLPRYLPASLPEKVHHAAPEQATHLGLTVPEQATHLGLAVAGVDALAQALGSRVQAAPVCSCPVGAGQGQVMPQLAGGAQNPQRIVLQLLRAGLELSKQPVKLLANGLGERQVSSLLAGRRIPRGSFCSSCRQDWSSAGRLSRLL